eukprot:FR741464.1.p1 GENE.FR741464.1~~FR741464.1.p1  ORF type:complete len:128 (+),score=16.77 FR741464.1:183-566(+)
MGVRVTANHHYSFVGRTHTHIQVKAAEADAESKYLSGIGVARQRKAIVDGLKDSIVDFSDGVEGTRPKDVMDLLLLTQYFDMIKEVGSHGAQKTLFMPHGPASVSQLQSDLRTGLMNQLDKPVKMDR